MTPQEHKLIVFMLAKQTQAILALVELLKARGIAINDDFLAFQNLIEMQDHQEGEAFWATISQYTSLAEGLGVEGVPTIPDKS